MMFYERPEFQMSIANITDNPEKHEGWDEPPSLTETGL